RLFHPPSVRGWERGRAWATTSGLFLRGELAGLLLGRVRPRDIVAELPDPGDRAGASDARPAAPAAPAAKGRAGARRRIPPELRNLGSDVGRPRLNLTQRMAFLGASRDDELARALLDELLAIPVPAALVDGVRAKLARGREELGLAEGALVAHPEVAEP